MLAFDFDTSLDRSQHEPETRRACVLREAERLFAAQGYDRVTVRGVSDAAGVNVATLHLHWKNKATLYEAVCRLHARHLVELVAEVATQADRLDTGAQVDLLVDNVVALFARHPAIAPMAVESFSGQAPPDLPTLMDHDVQVVSFVEAEIRKRMTPERADEFEPVLVLFSGLYTAATLFCDSPVQRALLGGSVYEDPDVRERAARFLRGTLRALIGADT